MPPMHPSPHTPKIKSPLRYPGGKSRVASQLCEMIPTDIREFREPFLGGGSVSLTLTQLRPSLEIYASDALGDLIAFWTCLKFIPGKLIRGIQHVHDAAKNGDGQALFQRMRQRQANVSQCLESAIDFYVMNRITFSGTTAAGGFSRQAFEKRFTQSGIDRLRHVADILTMISFHHSDYQAEIHRPGEDVFIFLDPPYHSATKSALYGKNGRLHTQFDHHQLAENLNNCHHRWLMTIDDSPTIRQLYKNFNIRNFQVQYGMNNIGGKPAAKGSELLITNH